jgi:hypothetical protein
MMEFSSRTFLKVFIALSFLSLFADIVYEGARSISGAYLNVLAAPAIAAGILSFGELLSYVMRLVGGVAAQKVSFRENILGPHILGICLDAFRASSSPGRKLGARANPILLGEAWEGIRAPPRDVILAEVTEGIGRGKGFGLHELMDQVGAMTGPLIVSLVSGFPGISGGI